jgi:photosystem II stability/assembly factor-like uncharacterized protein
MRNFRLLLLFILLVPASLAAQTVTWTPLAGPPGSVGRYVFLRNDDSAFANGSYELSGNGVWMPQVYRKVMPTSIISYIDAAFQDTLYSVAHDTVYVSRDSGSTWSLLGVFGDPPNQHSSTIVETVSGTVIIENDSGFCFASSDGFKTVRTSRVPIEQDHIPDVAPLYYEKHGIYTQGDSLYVSSYHSNLYRSTDYGGTWNEIIHVGDTLDPNKNYGLYFAQDGTMLAFQQAMSDSDSAPFISQDGGHSWLRGTAPRSAGAFREVHIDRLDHIYVTFGDADTLYRSDDLCQTWQKIFSTRFGIQYFRIDKHNSLLIPEMDYGGEDTNIFSRDFGATWEPLPTTGLLAVPKSFVVIKNSLYLSTGDGLYQSIDAGFSWQVRSGITDLNGPPNGLLDVGFDGDLIWNSWNGVWSSADEGNTFAKIGKPPINSYSPASVVSLFIGDSTLWIASAGYNSENSTFDHFAITGTMDRGTTWLISDTISDLTSGLVLHLLEGSTDSTVVAVSMSSTISSNKPSIVFNDVTPTFLTGAAARDSTGGIIVASMYGMLFRTTDDGTTWNTIPAPSFDMNVVITCLVATPHGGLFAIDSDQASSFVKIIQFDSKDSTWTDISATLIRPGFGWIAQPIALYYYNNFLYAATNNLGFFRAQDPVASVSRTLVTESNSDLIIYPNPASEIIHLQLPNNFSGEVRIVDETGRLISKQHVAGANATLDVSIIGLINGVYYAIAESTFGVNVVGTFVVAH